MAQIRCSLCFAIKTLPVSRVIGQATGQNLDGNQPVEIWIMGFVDGPHSALTEPPDNLVLADLFRDWVCHFRLKKAAAIHVHCGGSGAARGGRISIHDLRSNILLPKVRTRNRIRSIQLTGVVPKSYE